MKIHTSKGKIILQQLEQQGLSKKQMRSFVVTCIQDNLDTSDNMLLNQDLQIQHDSKGKPFLTGENAPNISISYAENWISVHLSTQEKIGIDLEFISNKILKIVDFFVSDSEKKKFTDLTIETLQLIWGAKEAVYKLHGGDFKDLKNEVEITEINFQEKTIEAKTLFGITLCQYIVFENGLFLVSC